MIRARGRTAEVNELGGRKLNLSLLFEPPLITKRSRIWEKKYGKGAKHVKQREEDAEKKKIKEEKRLQREAVVRRPRWAVKKAFEPPKQTDSGYKGRFAAKPGGGRVDGQPPLMTMFSGKLDTVVLTIAMGR